MLKLSDFLFKNPMLAYLGYIIQYGRSEEGIKFSNRRIRITRGLANLKILEIYAFSMWNAIITRSLKSTLF